LRISLGFRNFCLYGEKNEKGKALFLTIATNTTQVINWVDLKLKPYIWKSETYDFLQLRWYSLAYIFGIVIAWWILNRMTKKPGSPLAPRHAEDLIFACTLGVILGGRFGYILGYKPNILAEPWNIFKLWEGGMSFHGGVIGVAIAVFWLIRKEKLQALRVYDYIACTFAPGMLLGRLANFVNGELWGRPTDGTWGIIFPEPNDGIARHPSQLYQAGLEGLVIGLVMWWLYAKTEARYYPGRLAGAAMTMMGAFRFFVEFYREPDKDVSLIFELTRGQAYCIPLFIGGVYLLATSAKRRQRVESFAGTNSVA
jgi:phosphatidylglycerol---prolipoprotein diacylglyceryl transferase